MGFVAIKLQPTKNQNQSKTMNWIEFVEAISFAMVLKFSC